MKKHPAPTPDPNAPSESHSGSDSAPHSPPAEAPADLAAYRARFEEAMGVPFTRGNRVEALRNGDRIFPPMLAAIDGATQAVEFVTFVFWTGDIARRFADAFARAARRGVTVRVLLDAFGCAPIDQDLLQQMEDAGVAIAWFRPLLRLKIWKNDHRTHRKVLVCDQQTAFTGGVGIAAEWEGDAGHPDAWRDTHFCVRGPAVAGVRAAFIGNWVEAGRPLPNDTPPADARSGTGEGADEDADEGTEGGTDATGSADVQTVRSTASVEGSEAFLLHCQAVALARRSLYITTAYLAPHPRIADQLADAVARGVDVRILVPGPHADKRVARLAAQDNFGPLLAAGVRIYAYQPTMIHAKIISIDGRAAVLGSANFNGRSTQKDDEVCLTVLSPPLVRGLDDDFHRDLADAVEIDPARWRRRPLWQRVKEKLVRPFEREM